MPFRYQISLDGIVDSTGSGHGLHFDVDDIQDEPDIDRIEPDGNNDDPFDFDPFDDDEDFPGDEDAEEGEPESFEEVFEQIDQSINEVDIDPDPELSEPDWNTTDEDWLSTTTEISQEDDPDQDSDDDDSAETDDEEESNPEAEIRQEDEIEQDDSTAQLEEIDVEEPIIIEEFQDFDLIDGDELEEAIFQDLSDPEGEVIIEDIIGAQMEGIDLMADDLNDEPPIDYTDLSFDEEAEPAIVFEDFYDPSQSEIGEGPDDLIDMTNPLDDVFVDLMPDDTLGDPFFAFMDDLDGLDFFF